MAGAVARLLVQIVGDSSSATAAFKKTAQSAGEAEGAAKKTGGAWSGVGKVAAAVGGAFAAAKVVDFAKQSVAAASDLNESWSKVGVVFGTSAGEVQKWSQTSATSMGMSQQAALEAAGTYGNLAVALGLPPKKAADMSTSLVKLGGDLASFNNVPVGDALEALKSGLTGETEPLKRFGVNLNQASIEAKALTMGLVKAPVNMEKVGLASKRLALAQRNASDAVKKYGANSKQAQTAMVGVASSQANMNKAMAGGNVELTAAQKAQATYALIMEQTTTAQGDFARTSDGMANQQRIAAAEMENMKATLGSALLPLLGALAGILTSTLIPALQVFANFIKNNATVVEIFAAAIVAVIAVTKIWQISTAILNSTLLANPIFLIVAAVVALIAVIVLVATKTRFFQTVWNAAWGLLKTIFSWIRGNWPLLVSILFGPFGIAAALIIRNWSTLTRFIAAAWRAASGAVIAAWNAVWGFIQRVFGWIRSNWPLLVGILAGPFGVAVALIIRYWSGVSGFFSGIISSIAGVFSRVIGYITAPFITAFNIVKGVVAAAVGYISGLIGNLTRVVSGGINTAKSVYNAFARTWNAVQVGVPGVKILGKTVVPGFTFGLPDLPTLARGGLMTASGLVYAHAGEVITPAPASATARTGPALVIQNATFADPVDVELLLRKLAFHLQAGRL